MKLGFGRVLPAAPLDEQTTADRRVARRPVTARVVPEGVVSASEQARAIVARAEAAASALVAQAETRAAALGAELATRAKSDAATALAARELAVAAREANARERHLDDSVALARLLAERLLGEALRVDPSRVVALARQALTEARGARQVSLAAHPEDVPLLERALAAGELTPLVLVVGDPKRPRGSLRLDTELGTLDAELAPQLDRLAEKLREALRHA